MHAYKSFPERFSSDNLRNLFYGKIASTTSVGIDKKTPMRFSQDLSKEIDLILKKVSSGCYKFTAYRLLLCSKGPGKIPRELNVATVRDRLTLAALAELLDDVYGEVCATPHPHMLVGEARRAIECGRYTHCLKADMRGFYASIPHDRLSKVLGKTIRKKEIRSLIDGAIRTPNTRMGTRAQAEKTKGVPEGLAISNRLANIFAGQLDMVFTEKEDVRYMRYVDDILIFYDSRTTPDIRGELEREVDSLGLRLNKDKTAPYELGRESFQFLGYDFQPDGCLSVRRSSVLRLEQAIDRELRKMRGKAGRDLASALRHLNIRITGCRITEDNVLYQRFGWLHYYSRIDDVSLLCQLDALVAKLVKRYSLDVGDSLKSFKKSYYQMRYKATTTTYIPTYDMQCSTEQKRKDLEFLLPQENWALRSDEEIERLYSRRIRALVSRLEKDVGAVS